jgi:hypothetical protein
MLQQTVRTIIKGIQTVKIYQLYRKLLLGGTVPELQDQSIPQI